jgi:hypothetical protein
MKLITAAALAVAFVSTASAFDNTSCKDFLTGSWTLETERDGASIHAASSYASDGNFTQTMHITTPDGKAQDMSRSGTWDAGPGTKPDACVATLTPAGEEPSTIELTVVDGNTVTNPEGLASHRVVQ